LALRTHFCVVNLLVRLMKKVVILIAVGGLAVAGYFFWHHHKAPVAATADNTTRPNTATIELRNIDFAVTAAGEIGPDDMVSVRPEINGRISQLPVDIGDKVTKGDLLCALDDSDLQSERSTQITQIEGAKLQVEKAKRNFDRNKQLHEGHLVSQEVYDDSVTDFEMSKNALELAEKTLSQIEVQISKTRIVAPLDCTVLTRPVSVGQAISGSGGVGGGTEIMTIANLKEMIITAHMNQADVPRLRLGQAVDVEVEAVPGMKIKGAVERIAPQATIKNNIKGFETQIRLKNLDSVVRPGMTANMTIPLQSAANAVAIPLAAVFSEENDRYTFVRNQNGEFEIRPIHIGVADFQYAEVLDGLQNGDVVSMVRPEKFVGDLHDALSKMAANTASDGNPRKFAAGANTNALTSATNQPAPSASPN
jgi:RND family efflux transporter MFP subunit